MEVSSSHILLGASIPNNSRPVDKILAVVSQRRRRLFMIGISSIKTNKKIVEKLCKDLEKTIIKFV